MYTPASPKNATCFPVTKVVRYRAKRFGHLSGEYAMIKELANGPITCGIACSDGFTYDYKAGIYEDTTGFMDIDHDVEIVGWGEENGVKYWHVRNSWGTYWGMNGFFKIVRGKNNLGIEADCAFVEPDITDEELVWEENPVYGGSIFGIVPFKATAKDHPIEDTQDVTRRDDLQPADMPSASDALATISTAATGDASGEGFFAMHAFSFFVAGCVCTAIAVLVVVKTRIRRYVYHAIS